MRCPAQHILQALAAQAEAPRGVCQLSKPMKRVAHPAVVGGWGARLAQDLLQALEARAEMPCGVLQLALALTLALDLPPVAPAAPPVPPPLAVVVAVHQQTPAAACAAGPLSKRARWGLQISY